MARLIRVALVDDHPVVLEGLHTALSTVPDIQVVARAASLGEARMVVLRDDVDVLLLDVRLPDGNGLELLEDATGRGRIAVLVLSSFRSRQYLAAALRFGASGFLLKTTPLPELISAIRSVAMGGTAFTSQQLRDGQAGLVSLTDREREILRLLLAGRSNDEMAAELRSSRKGVEYHLSRLYERFDVTSRVELALKADHEGWLELSRERASSGRRSRQRPT